MKSTKSLSANLTAGLGATVFSVAIISILSRLLSLVSTQMYLAYFGATGFEINVYQVAITIPNVLFTSIGATLTTIVVPIYSSLINKDQESEAKAKSFIDSIITLVLLISLLLIGIGFLLAPIMPVLTGHTGEGEAAYLIFALRVIMPVMIFYSLNYVFQGLLQSRGHFKLPAAVSLPSSLTLILYLLFLSGRFQVTGLLFATLLGLSLQAVILLPKVLQSGYRYKPSFDLKSEEIKTAGRLCLPMLLSASAYQINMLFSTVIAARFNMSTLIGNVQNLLLASILTFVYSLTAVYYPRLSALFAKSVDEYKASLEDIISLLLFFLIPAVLGFILLRYSLFDFIARFRNFTEADVKIAGDLMGIFACGIPALGLKEVFDRAFYAQKNPKISAMVGFLIMGLNVLATLAFMNFVSFYACALAYSLSSTTGVCVLYLCMRKKIGAFDRQVFVGILKCILAAVLMGGAIYLIKLFAYPLIDNVSIINRGIRLFLPVLVGVLIYFSAAYVLGIKECRKLLKFNLKI